MSAPKHTPEPWETEYDATTGTFTLRMDSAIENRGCYLPAHRAGDGGAVMNTALPSYFAAAHNLDAVAAGDPFASSRLATHMHELASPSGLWLEHERTPAGLRLTARCIAAMRQQAPEELQALYEQAPLDNPRWSLECRIANADGMGWAQVPQWRDMDCPQARAYIRVTAEALHRRRQAREHRTVTLLRDVFAAARREVTP